MKTKSSHQARHSPRVGTARSHQYALVTALAVGLFGLLAVGAQESDAKNLAQLKAL